MKKLTIAALTVIACLFAVSAARAAELTPPQGARAGAGFIIGASGSGQATFYLIGPTSVVKRQVRLGRPIAIAPQETQGAGRYLAIVHRGSESNSVVFWVDAGKPDHIAFIARPSRLPVARTNGISGVVYPFDKWHNLIVRPEQVKFQLAVGEAPPLIRTLTTSDGVAWTEMDSSRKAGPAQFTASIGDVSERRVVQQVASDPCNLRMRAQRSKQGIEVVTDPILDCTSNPVPDGTIVTFTATSAQGRSSVDARIKRGFADAELPPMQSGNITVASGVVMGNEIHWGGGE